MAAAFFLVLADGCRDNGFQHGKRGSQRGKNNQQHEHGKQIRTHRHFHEDRRQHNKNQTRALAGFKTEGKYRRENHQTGQQRHKQVHPHNHVAGAEHILILTQIRSIGNHRGHADTQGKKRLTQSSQHRTRFQIRPIRFQQECHALHCAGQSQRTDSQRDKEDKQTRHQHAVCLFNAV